MTAFFLKMGLCIILLFCEFCGLDLFVFLMHYFILKICDCFFLVFRLHRQPKHVLAFLLAELGTRYTYSFVHEIENICWAIVHWRISLSASHCLFLYITFLPSISLRVNFLFHYFDSTCLFLTGDSMNWPLTKL